MILKIKHHGSWWLFDGLTRIHYGINHTKGEGKDKVFITPNGKCHRLGPDEKFDFKIEDKDDDSGFYPDICLFDVPDITKLTEVSWVSAINYNNNREMFFVFEKGYILNDEGRTIERV